MLTTWSFTESDNCGRETWFFHYAVMGLGFITGVFFSKVRYRWPSRAGNYLNPTLSHSELTIRLMEGAGPANHAFLLGKLACRTGPSPSQRIHIPQQNLAVCEWINGRLMPVGCSLLLGGSCVHAQRSDPMGCHLTSEGFPALSQKCRPRICLAFFSRL
jgi:hypothetical protein